MNEIVQILMRRDGISAHEAREMYFDCKAMIDEAVQSGNEFDVEDILLDELGLEMDYIFCFL